MKKLLIVLMVFVILGLAAALASAQTPIVNPTKVQYTVSPDHSTLTKYVLGYFLPGATDPVQTADLMVQTPAGDQTVEQPLPSLPVGYGTYVGRLRGVAGAVAGEWSAPSNEFLRAPLPPPTAPTVRK